MDNNYKIVLTGGGSGGHVIPALALLPQLRERFYCIYYVGADGVEKRLAQNEGLPYFEIKASGLNRKSAVKNLKLPLTLIKSVSACVKHFKDIKPDVVFSKGGYVGLPPIIAARLLHIPTACHESDLTLGLSNKIAFRLGATVLTGFYQTSTLSRKFVHSGFPFKQSLFFGDKAIISQRFNLDASKPTLLVVGGSLGSVALNQVIISALPRLTAVYNVIHLTGKNKLTEKDISGYFMVDYADDIQNYYATADVIVSRCGAGALTEISALEKSAVFVPLPKNASRGDQLENAKLALSYGAKVVLQENLTPDTLLQAINNAYRHPMQKISVAENVKIADILFSIAETHKRK